MFYNVNILVWRVNIKSVPIFPGFVKSGTFSPKVEP